MFYEEEKYTKQSLLFYVARDVDIQTCEKINACIVRLAEEHHWLIGPPQFVNTTDNAKEMAEEAPDTTIGGVLQIYSALAGNLPRYVDVKSLQDVEKLVRAVQELSQREDLEFEFELDGEFVGTIDAGELDQSLKIGLLEEWHRQIEN